MSRNSNGGSGKPTLHVLSLPHTQLTKEYVSCAYTSKARNFAKMMESIGYSVVVYASEDFDPEIKGEKVTCITKKKQHEFFGDNDHKKTFYNITWGPDEAHWQHFNKNAIKEIKKRIKPGDIIGHFAGYCQKQVGDAFPQYPTVELGIGYTGCYSMFKVFESYSHMHYCHGDQKNDNGSYYHTVIPSYQDAKEFPFSRNRGDENGQYFLYIGRLITRKGFLIAQQICERLGKRLILAGQVGDEGFSGYGEYIGTVDVEERGKLMSRATAVFLPTIYIEPFGNTHIEAQLAGVPVITSNFGVFTETVKQGFNGYRCDTFGDFLEATKRVEKFNTSHRKQIREHAQKTWGLKPVALMYDQYFQRIADLKGDGWYSERNSLDFIK